jgi:hypothetical protein
MMKKLRNQLYAPKVGASSQIGAKKKKKNMTVMYEARSLHMHSEIYKKF